MKSFPYYLFLFFSCLLLSSCDPGKEAPVMTNNSIFQSYIDEVNADVKNVENKLGEMLRYEFDSLDFHLLSTEYPYWQSLHVYFDDKGIRKAKLYADYDKGRRTEEFYFRKGKLVYGRINENGLLHSHSEADGNKFYFTEGKLIFALDNSGKQKDVKHDSVKIKAIDLVNEARQIQKIMAAKDIKP